MTILPGTAASQCITLKGTLGLKANSESQWCSEESGNNTGTMCRVLVFEIRILLIKHQQNHRRCCRNCCLESRSHSVFCCISYFSSVDCSSCVCGAGLDVAVGSQRRPAAADDDAQRRGRKCPKNPQDSKFECDLSRLAAEHQQRHILPDYCVAVG